MVHPMEGLIGYTSEERHYHANNISWCLLPSVFGVKDEEFPLSMGTSGRNYRGRT